MGKILQSFISDNLGKPVVMIGAGRILEMVQNYSGDKISQRLVLHVLIEFDDKTLEQVVIKLGLIEDDFKTTSDTTYTSNFSGETYNNSTLENQYYQEVIIAQFLKDNITSPQLTNKILPILGAGVLTDNTIKINDELFDLTVLGSITSGIFSKKNVTYLVTEYNPSFKVLLTDGIPTSWFSEIPAQKIYNLITSGIDVLEYTYGKYKFCHWDFHAGNIIYDNDTGLIKLFDFDLSTIDISPLLVFDSQYIERVDYFYTLIDNIKYSQGLFYDKIIKYESFENSKYMLAHYFDLFQFLMHTQNKIEQAYRLFTEELGELPDGWSAKISAAGETYYYKIATGESQFEFPSDTMEFYLPNLHLEDITEYNKLISNYKKTYTDYKRLIELKNSPILKSKFRSFLKKNPKVYANPSIDFQFSSFIVNLPEAEIQQFQPLEINFIKFIKQIILDTGDSINYIRALYIFCGALLLKYDYSNLSTRIGYIISKYEQTDELPPRDHDEIDDESDKLPPRDEIDDELDELPLRDHDESVEALENFEKITREIEELKQELM